MNIYIVRHGETKSNEQGRLQGWTNDPLNDMGVLLARETGKAMKGIRFNAVFSSSLVRAYNTAEIILRESGNDNPIQIDDRIKEICMGDFEGKKFKPGECEVDPAAVKQFFINPMEAPGFPNGESVRDVMARTQDFLKDVATKDYESVLIATHGCALRCMLNFLYENPFDFWHGHVPYNCCVNVIEVKDGELKLVEDDMILYNKNLCVDRYARF